MHIQYTLCLSNSKVYRRFCCDLLTLLSLSKAKSGNYFRLGNINVTISLYLCPYKKLASKNKPESSSIVNILMKTRIAAHRGVPSLAPENTLAGIYKAAELGLSWIEIDTQLSADGIPVIVHDRTVNRCSSGHGAVADLYLSELQQLDVGSWFDEAFADQRMPSLSQVLTVCQSLQLQINLELKIHAGDDIQLLCEQVASVIEESQFPVRQLLISSFDHQAIAGD